LSDFNSIYCNQPTKSHVGKTFINKRNVEEKSSIIMQKRKLQKKVKRFVEEEKVKTLVCTMLGYFGNEDLQIARFGLLSG